MFIIKLVYCLWISQYPREVGKMITPPVFQIKKLKPQNSRVLSGIQQAKRMLELELESKLSDLKMVQIQKN